MRREFAVPVFVVTFLVVPFLTAASAEKEKPDRAIVASMEYPRITLAPDDKVSSDLIVKNRGKTDETVFLTVVEKPEGWKARIKSYSKTVNGVFVPVDGEKTLTFSAEPEDKKVKKLPAGKYKFAVKTETEDGKLSKTAVLEVTVLEKEKAEKPVTVETSYPELRGPADQKFEFSLDVRNETDEDGVFNFKADAPRGWEVSFKPSYEDKQISSLQIGADQSKSVDVEVQPAYNAEIGEYPITVSVESSLGKAEAQLKVIVTGTYKIDTGTPLGLLSYTARAGKETSITLLVKNSGSAPQRDITFSSFKPENWEVKFDPEKLEGLEPGEVKQVEVKIKPAEEAIIGDYSVQISTDGERASDTVEFRITVKASATWGWIGVAIIAFVIIGLAVVFKLLGRR